MNLCFLDCFGDLTVYPVFGQKGKTNIGQAKNRIKDHMPDLIATNSVRAIENKKIQKFNINILQNSFEVQKPSNLHRRIRTVQTEDH